MLWWWSHINRHTEDTNMSNPSNIHESFRELVVGHSFAARYDVELSNEPKHGTYHIEVREHRDNSLVFRLHSFEPLSLVKLIQHLDRLYP